MKNLIAVLALIAVLGLAIYYIVRQKKRGIKCIGCPSVGCCPVKGNASCDCTKINN